WRDNGVLAPGESLFLIIEDTVKNLEGLPEAACGDFEPLEARITGRNSRKRCRMVKLPEPGKRIWLDCGMPSGVVEAVWNGRTLGTCFAPPYRFEITGLLKKENVFSIKVTEPVNPRNGHIFDQLIPHRINGDEYPRLIMQR
ncbi:MAG: hypothetical protein J6S21_07645, partial [Victivallales bacterium]|nr:hypothetical protein [Victivallales bacterium]